MAKYRFRLETLKKVRAAARDERRAALAEAFRAAEIIAAKKREIEAEALATRALRQSATAARYMDINRLLEAQRYDMLLKTKAEELAKQELLLTAEIERRRQQLVEADREVRALELLDERHRQTHAKKQARLETRQLDEAAIVKWGRE